MALTLDGSLLRPQRDGTKTEKNRSVKASERGEGRYIHYMVSSLRMEEAGAY